MRPNTALAVLGAVMAADFSLPMRPEFGTRLSKDSKNSETYSNIGVTQGSLVGDERVFTPSAKTLTRIRMKAAAKNPGNRPAKNWKKKPNK